MHGPQPGVVRVTPASTSVNRVPSAAARASSRLDAGVIYKLKPWLSTALGCKAFWSEKPDHWPVTRMPVMDLWLYAPMHSLQITWQHKWEYQVAEQGGAAVVHRQKITLAAARPWSVWKVQPFMAGEFFYNFNLEHVSFRRWFSGFYLQPPNQPLRLGLQYLLQESWSPARQTLYHCLIFYAKLTW